MPLDTSASADVRQATTDPSSGATAPRLVDIVVKVGGGLLASAQHLDAVLREIGVAARVGRLLVVPGGGPFADAVREVDRRLGLSDAAAHWMAVLAMDQHAHLLHARLPASELVEDPLEIAAALAAGHVPVLAPSRWLRAADPLPHMWDVTSDSIAAWIAGAVGAERLILIKPPGAAGPELVDGWFARALPAHVTPVIVPADHIEILRSIFGDGIDRT
jgi:aspartokinase-like uncharacterized kinase